MTDNANQGAAAPLPDSTVCGGRLGQVPCAKRAGHGGNHEAASGDIGWSDTQIRGVRPRCPTCGHLTARPRGHKKKLCKVCGHEFVPYTGNAVFCSSRCKTIRRSEDARRKRIALTQPSACTSPNGRTDGHMSYVKRNEDGTFACAFCGEREPRDLYGSTNDDAAPAAPKEPQP